MIGYYSPQRLNLTDTKPEGVKAVPADVTAPHFGELKMGGKSYIVLVDQPADKRVAGADTVDDLHRVARRITELAAREKQRAGLGLGQPGQGDERRAVSCSDRGGELFSSLREAQHMLRVALGHNQQADMRRHQIEQVA